MNRAHNSITEEYIKDYVRLSHEVYVPFITKMSTIYYNLEVSMSNYSEDFNAFYKNVDNVDHGGRYTAIYNFPVYMGTSNVLTDEGTDKGITTMESTNINCNVDSMVNVELNEEDLIAFNNGLDHFGVYRIIDLDMSSTLLRPHYKLTLQIVPNLSVEKMRRFLVNEKFFLTNYHYVFGKEESTVIISIQRKLNDMIEYFNGIYDSKLDAHVDSKKCVYLEFERAFNNMITKYSGHIFTATINRSYLCDNLLSYYSDTNPFSVMLGLNGDVSYQDFSAKLTMRNPRLDKSRRRMVNNRIKIYRIGEDETSVDLELPIEKIETWKRVVSAEFLDNIRDEMTNFISSCNVNPSDMFGNAIATSQLFFILDSIVNSKMANKTNYFTTVKV